METPSTPGAAAPATPSATPAASSTPVSTPATPTPATPPAAAPVAAPAAETAPVEDNRSTEQILQEKIAAGFSKDGHGGEPREGDDPGVTVPDVPGDEGEIEHPAAEAAEVPAAEEVAAADDLTADIDLLDADYGADVLAAAIAKDPAVTEALEANPELKAAVYANARKAERASKYDEIVGSPEEARVAVEGHGAFTKVSTLMSQVKDGDFNSVNNVINAMLEHAVQRDEDGNPLKNADGTVMTNGSVGGFLKNWFTQRMLLMEKNATEANDDEALAAIDTLMARAGLRTPASANEEEMSEELKAQKASIEAREKALSTQETNARTAALQASEGRVNTQTDTAVDGLISGILKKATGLDDFSRGAAEKEIRKGLQKALSDNPRYWSERDAIEARPVGAKREKALVELNQRYAANNIPRIARSVLSQAGASVIQRSADRSAAQAARERAAASESRGSLPPARTAPAADSSAMPQVIADLTTKLGREPSTQEILQERMIRMQKVPA